MDIDSKIQSKIEELQQLKMEIDKLDLMDELKPGEEIKFNTTEEIFQSGELRIMEEIAIGEFNLLLIQKHSDENSKPLTWKNFIELKKKELEEHRDMQKKQGLELTSFRYKA